MAKFYTEEEINFLKMYAPMYGAKICSEKLGRELQGVQSKLSRLGIRSHRDKNITDEDIQNLKFISSFKALDIDFNTTQFPKELAYYMGFFWADGYCNKRGELKIEITEEDGIALEPIFMRLASFRIYKRSRKGRKPQMTFYYKDLKIAECFINLGKYSKSTESHQKILGYIPRKYHIYFIRGLIDGDGCWYYNGKITQFSISAAINYDWNYLCNYLKNNLNFKCKIYSEISTKSKGSIIRNTNPLDISMFIECLYKIKDNIWLNRKFQKTQYILNNKKYEYS